MSLQHKIYLENKNHLKKNIKDKTIHLVSIKVNKKSNTIFMLCEKPKKENEYILTTEPKEVTCIECIGLGCLHEIY